MEEKLKKILEADNLVTAARQDVETMKANLKQAKDYLDETVINLHRVILEANDPQILFELDVLSTTNRPDGGDITEYDKKASDTATALGISRESLESDLSNVDYKE